MQINSKLGIGAAQVSLPSQSHEELMDTLFALSHCNCVARCGKHAKHAPHAETQLKFPKVVPTTHQARHLSLASTMPQYETPGLSHRVGCHKLPCLHPGFGAAQVSLPGSNHEGFIDLLFALSRCNLVSRSGVHPKHAPHAGT